MRRLIALLFISVAAGCAPDGPGFDWESARIVDLSHTFDAETVFWPTAGEFELESSFKGFTEGGFYYEANVFRSAEHGGTHLDAPIHFAEGGHTTEAIPLRQLVGEAVVVDVSEACASNPDYLVTVDDVERWEQEHGRIPDNAIVLLRTGYASRWPDRTRYLGTDERGQAAVAKLHFPGLDPDAARWLVANRTISALGIDTASIDYGQSTTFESHRILFEKNIPAFENVASLATLPATGAYVVALPMKIGGGSGGPLRIIALVP